ncbi:GerAB/ArcD/ProY family transporter [Paenibacillus donghaensis]|nr:endospore germination permease [Paenibacillus donghaensis]
MGKETIPSGHSVSIIILFVTGTSLFMGVAGSSGNSSWISILFAMVLAFPLMLLYARLHTLFPGRDLFDMLITVFGGILGRLFSCLYIWYAMHLGALILRNFGEFSKTVALTATPMLAPMLCIGLLCIWVVKAGLEVLGRSAKFLVLLTIAATVIVQLLCIPKFQFHHLLPLIDNGWPLVFTDTMGTFTFPFAEIVVFLGAFTVLPEKANARKIMLGGLFYSGGIILLVSLRNLLMLGPDTLSTLYFPTYVAISRINVGDFLTRIEGSVSFIFVTAIFVKVSLCLYMASNGVAKIFKLKSYRSVVLQIGLIMIYFADFVYKDIMEMQYFAYHIYKIYALPFQVGIPLVLWVCAEIAAKRNKRKKEAAAQH